jgi:phospholipase/carboxylesterase
VNARRRWIVALTIAAALAVAALGLRPAQATLVRNPASQLDTWEVGAGPLPLILLHGYAATPREWLPFSHTILIHDNRRFVFPQAPEETVPPDGPVGGRAWWRLDLASYLDGGVNGVNGGGNGGGGTLPDMSHARPPGLAKAAEKIRLLIGDLHHREAFDDSRVIVGGFSQGAMIAAEVAFRSEQRLEALILLSPTFVDEQRWIEGMARRKGMPVFISHGRRDDVLPFAASERLATAMRDAGLKVTWAPFDGIHETPASVVTELNKFLASVEPVQ